MAQLHVGLAAIALVDDEDFDRLVVYRWSLSHGYAKRSLGEAELGRCQSCGLARRGQRYLHHEVLGLSPSPDLVVDHRNGDPLDCRKSNLRWVTRQQNQWNLSARTGVKKSRFKGVSHQTGGGWIAYIGSGNERRHLGTFPSEEAAAEAYNRAAMARFGEYARLNDTN